MGADTRRILLRTASGTVTDTKTTVKDTYSSELDTLLVADTGSQ